MATTSNIFVGIATWSPTTSYTVGNRVSNGGNAYQCTSAGTSSGSGGPSGTGLAITDGSVAWKYLAHVDYVTISTWVSGIPATLSQPIIGLLWDCGAITTAVGTPYVTFSGHTTTTTNTITLTAAPGESIRDLLAAGNLPLAADNSAPASSSAWSSGFSAGFGPTTTSHGPAWSSGFSSGFGPVASVGAGVRFVLPSSGAGNTNYIAISDSNVILDGLQFIDTNSTSNCSHIQVSNGTTGTTIRNCIFDGYGQAGGASILDVAGALKCYNCLLVDRMPANSYGMTIQAYGSGVSGYINCTIIGTNSNTGNGSALQVTSVTGCYVRNCAIFGYSVPLQANSSATTFDHCALSVSSLASPITDGGGNVLSLSAAGQFINPASDWRLALGNGVIAKGTPDTTDIPSADDIGRHARVGWEPGAWEFSLSSVAAPSFEVIRTSGYASLTTPTDSASCRVSFGLIKSVASLGQGGLLSGLARIFFVRSVVLASQANQSSSSGSPWSSGFSQGFGPFSNAIQVNVLTFISNVSPVGYAVLTEFWAASAQVFTVFSTGIASVSNATAQTNVLPLACNAIASMLGATISFATISCVASATPVLLFSGSSNIDWQPAISASSSTTASSGVSLPALRAASAISQYDKVYCVASIPTLSVSSSVGTSCSAVIGLPTLAALAGAGQYEIASAALSIEVLAVATPTPALIEADGGSPVWLAADGSGLTIAADIVRPNLVSTTFGAGLALVLRLSAVGSTLTQIFCAGSASVSLVSPSVQLQQSNQASGKGAVAVLSDYATAILTDGTLGLASIGVVTGSGSAIQRVVASALSTMSLAAGALAEQFSQASGSQSISVSASSGALLSNGASVAIAFARLNVAAALVLQDVWSAVSTVGQMAASGTMQSFTTASAVVTQSLTSHAIAGIGTVATGSPTLEGMGASGLASLSQRASGASTVSISAIGVTGQSLNASGSVSIQIGAAVTANLSLPASGLASVMPLATGGALTSSIQANGQSATPAITCSGTAVNIVEFAGATVAAMTLSAVAAASFAGAGMSGDAVISFGASGQVVNSVEAAVLVELEQIVAAHARLWTTPTEYVQGDDLIWWQD